MVFLLIVRTSIATGTLVFTVVLLNISLNRLLSFPQSTDSDKYSAKSGVSRAIGKRFINSINLYEADASRWNDFTKRFFFIRKRSLVGSGL